MSAAFDNLTAAVTKNTDVEASAATMIEGLAAQVKATSNDPAVQALADKISASSGTLASAIAANTAAPATQSAPASPTQQPGPATTAAPGGTTAPGTTGPAQAQAAAKKV